MPGEAVNEAVAPRTKWAVRVFLLVFAVTGIAHQELWPFTGFRLFSELRGSERSGWSIVAVDAGGAERSVLLRELPVAYRNTTRQIPSLVDGSDAEREAACDAWATPLLDDGQDVAAIRVYATVSSVRPDRGWTSRTLAFECEVER